MALHGHEYGHRHWHQQEHCLARYWAQAFSGLWNGSSEDSSKEGPSPGMVIYSLKEHCRLELPSGGGSIELQRYRIGTFFILV